MRDEETPIHVVLAADANYRPGLEVTRASLVRSCSRPARLVFHVFDESALAGLGGLEDFARYNTSRMPYLRLFLPDLLPSVDWVVYSDVDTIWARDVCALARLFDATAAVQWVRDFESTVRDARSWMRKTGLAFDASRYGCSGVCLMNLEKLRRMRIGARALSLVRRFGTPPYADQDLLNLFCNRDCALLPDCWDVLRGLPDWRTPAVYHLTGVGRHFHDAAAPVAPPQYRLWWNVAHGTASVPRRARLLAALWPLRGLARLLPAGLRDRVLRQVFFAKVLASGRLSSAPTWLVDARTLASRPTGVGMYAKRRLARLMRETPDARFVLVCDVKASAEIRELEAAGAEVRAYGRRVFNSVGVLGYFRFVRRVVAEVRPTVFWQPNNLQPFRPKDVPRVVVTMHDVFGLAGWSVRYALWHLYYRLSFARTLRHATEVWFNSRETERQVRAAAPRLVARLVTRVDPPLADVPRRASVAPFAHARPYFLYLGNIERRKGADLLLAAYRRYRASAGANPCDLLFAGLEKNVAVPDMEGVAALGYVEEATKHALLCSAVALVVPSRAEGYGMQVAEAAALGVPCLASDLPVFREIDPAGRRVFPPGDVAALADLLAEAAPRPHVV